MRLSEVIKELPLLVRYPGADAYTIGAEVHTCANCGHEYQGNYCPGCGQKATAGRITWGTLWRTMALPILFYSEGLLLFFPAAFLQELAFPTKEKGALVLLIGFVFLVTSVALFCLVIDMINRRTWRTVGWRRALLFPLIALGMMLASLLAYELLKQGVLFLDYIK